MRTCCFDAAGNQTGDRTGSIGVKTLAVPSKYSGSFGAQFVQPLGSMNWFTRVGRELYSMTIILTGDLDPRSMRNRAFETDQYYGLVFAEKTGRSCFMAETSRTRISRHGGADVPLAQEARICAISIRGEVFGIQAAWEF